jgi:hypothetical protein
LPGQEGYALGIEDQPNPTIAEDRPALNPLDFADPVS